MHKAVGFIYPAGIKQHFTRIENVTLCPFSIYMKHLARLILGFVTLLLVYILIVIELDSENLNIFVLWLGLFLKLFLYFLSVELFTFVIRGKVKPGGVVNGNKRDRFTIFFACLFSSLIASIMMNLNVDTIFIILTTAAILMVIMMVFGSSDLKVYLFKSKS